MEFHQLPLQQLTGTPKQIAWAESIRARFIAAMDAHERDTESHFALRSVGYRDLI